ncbi:MAG: ferredoxin [Mycobacteriales bacterium]
MTFVITNTCLDLKDMSCIEECPVDCIYEGGRKLYIHPVECIDCGACEPVCPVDAIYPDRQLPADQVGDKADNALFFTSILPGQTAPIGSPGGSMRVGAVDADTPVITALPVASED